MTNELMTRLIKGSTIKQIAPLETSKVYAKDEMCATDIPIINIALSGELDGGFAPGLLQIAGQSKHFKTAFCLVMGAAYLKKYSDAILLFFDSEFGAPLTYFKMAGVDTSRVLHVPIQDVEELKFEIMAQFKLIKDTDKVMMIVDSIGGLASVKEVEDAENQNSVTDMSRAKALKSLSRIITPRLKIKKVPMIAINHTYKEQKMYGKDIVSGGQGLYLASNDIWVIGRQQEKEGSDLSGWNFIINIEKSRFVREKSKFPVTVTFDNGMLKWSGLFDIAREGGFIDMPSSGWYTVSPDSEKKYRADELRNNEVFWTEFLKRQDFKDYIENRYKLGEFEIESNINSEDDD